jgi:flagellar motor switch protein FliN/FliY
MFTLAPWALRLPYKSPALSAPARINLYQDKQIHKDVLQTISVTLSVEVGRAMIKIKDLMRLTQGSVVELDRIAGEPLDLLVNDTVVAQGEVVLVNERYGIRLTRVVPASERMKNL